MNKRTTTIILVLITGWIAIVSSTEENDNKRKYVQLQGTMSTLLGISHALHRNETIHPILEKDNGQARIEIDTWNTIQFGTKTLLRSKFNVTVSNNNSAQVNEVIDDAQLGTSLNNIVHGFNEQLAFIELGFSELLLQRLFMNKFFLRFGILNLDEKRASKPDIMNYYEDALNNPRRITDFSYIGLDGSMVVSRHTFGVRYLPSVALYSKIKKLTRNPIARQLAKIANRGTTFEIFDSFRLGIHNLALKMILEPANRPVRNHESVTVSASYEVPIWRMILSSQILFSNGLSNFRWIKLNTDNYYLEHYRKKTARFYISVNTTLFEMMLAEVAYLHNGSGLTKKEFKGIDEWTETLSKEVGNQSLLTSLGQFYEQYHPFRLRKNYLVTNLYGDNILEGLSVSLYSSLCIDDLSTMSFFKMSGKWWQKSELELLSLFFTGNKTSAFGLNSYKFEVATNIKIDL